MFLSLFLSFLLSANEPKNIFSEKIEVHVGTEIIATSDIQMMEESMRQEAPAGSGADLRNKARNALIDQALMSIYLQQMNYPVSDKDVDQRINSIRTSNNIATDEQFKSLLESRGMSFDKFRSQIKLQMEKMQFMNFIRRNAARTIEEKDLLAYFKNNAAEFKNNYEVELTECLIPYGEDPKEAQRRAEFFVNQPKKFNDCVKELSRGPSAARAGKLGTFTWGTLPEAVESKVSNLKAGEVAVIKQPTGIQLLKVSKSKNLGTITFQAAQERIRERLETEIVDKEIQKTLSDLRANTFIKIDS